MLGAMSEPTPNRYSQTWFEIFLKPIQLTQTERELRFITHYLPQPVYTSVLDLCCGQGRHALALAKEGYQVTGVDRDKTILAKARQQAQGQVSFFEHDMRYLADLSGSFDAVLSLWQSFGYFTKQTNFDILQQIFHKLNPTGRLILDLYNRDFFERHQGTRHFQKEDRLITSTQSMIGNRLRVQLDYGSDDPPDIFEWQLYTADEIRTLTQDLGFRPLIVCSDFDQEISISPTKPRMQIVLQKKEE